MPSEHSTARTLVVLAYALSVIIGVIAFIASPSAMQEETTSILRLVWAAFLCVGGGLGLTGSALRRGWGELFGAPLVVAAMLMYVVPITYRVVGGEIQITGLIIVGLLLMLAALLSARWIVTFRLFRPRE